MDSHDAVVYLALSAAPLPLDSHGVHPAFAHPRLIDHSYGLRVGMVRGDESLTPVAHPVLIPLDGFKKTL